VQRPVLIWSAAPHLPHPDPGHLSAGSCHQVRIFTVRLYLWDHLDPRRRPLLTCSGGGACHRVVFDDDWFAVLRFAPPRAFSTALSLPHLRHGLFDCLTTARANTLRLNSSVIAGSPSRRRPTRMSVEPPLYRPIPPKAVPVRHSNYRSIVWSSNAYFSSSRLWYYHT
jgi:hypothetical protein